MKTAFLGLGDYGSRLAARLIDGGTDLTLIARGERLAALRTEGLKSTNGFGGDAMHIENVSATDDPSQVGVVDPADFEREAVSVEPGRFRCGANDRTRDDRASAIQRR